MKKESRIDKFAIDCKWVYQKPIYHRGKFDNINVYENTMQAYKLALENKSSIELDVQLTSDLEVICFHDNSLKRLFNREREVNDISVKRLNKLRDDFQVPLLKDVLKLVDGKVGLMIELKHVNKRFNKILVKKVYELLKDYKGKYVIVSFNVLMLKAYKKLDKNAYIGRICSKNVSGKINRFMSNSKLLDLVIKPDFISCDIGEYDDAFLQRYSQKGYKIIGWTSKDKTREKVLKKQFDNFIIEY